MVDWRHRIAVVVLCVQLLLCFHTYRSTDFEVHRNWLAITHSLPISQWYYEARSDWTLDYPPLFAWFEWAMSQAAAWFDPAMLRVENLGYDSAATVLFQRLSVCVTSLVLVAAMLCATGGVRSSGSNNMGRIQAAQQLTAFALVVCNAGLIMVDNIHFQYNSILMGLLVVSILCLEEQRYVLGGLLFAVLLNMKHLFAYLAPVYFVFLLKHYVLTAPADGVGAAAGSGGSGGSDSTNNSSGSGSSWLVAAGGRLVLLGAAVLAVCGVSFGPFIAMGQIPQVLSRLFPFARGLCHAYWAPNAWALYSFADKLLAAAATKAGLIQPSASANMAGGIVGVSSYVVLPNVGAGLTALCVLVAMLPCLVALWKAPRSSALALIAPAIAYANLCGFMFGYHVHEKAALTVEVPLALAAARSSAWGQQYVLFSTAAHVGIFPLLFQTQEVPIRWLLAVVYYVIAVWGLASIHSGKQQQGASQQKQQQYQDDGASSSPSPAAAGAGVGTPSPAGVRTRRQLAQRQEQKAAVAAAAKPATPPKQPKASGVAAGSSGSGIGGVASMHECCSWLPPLHRLYLLGLVVLELYCSLGHKALLGERLPFVPLMLTSVYCAAGVTWVWGWMAWWFWSGGGCA